jgi:hypothetical protein
VSGLTDFKVNAIDLHNGLVAWYPFDGNASDMSGNAKHAQVQGPTLANDRFGNPSRAYDFESSGSSFTQQGQRIILPMEMNVGQFSLSIWVKPESYYWSGNSVHVSRIISTKRDNQNSSASIFYLTLTENELNFRQNVGIEITTDSTIPLGAWAHLTYTVDQGNLTVYKDGTNLKSTSFSATPGFQGSLMLGEEHATNGHWYYYDGLMDDVRIYDRALSVAEIQALYNLGQ